MSNRDDDRALPRVSLVTGEGAHAPVPDGPRRTLGDLPSGSDALATLSPSEREALLRGLALTRRDARPVPTVGDVWSSSAQATPASPLPAAHTSGDAQPAQVRAVHGGPPTISSGPRGSPPTATLDTALPAILEATDAVSLRQTLLLSAERGSLGFVCEEVGLDALLALGARKGVAVNDVLASTDTVKHRGLTTDEARRVRDNFFGTLDPATVRLRFTTGVQTAGAMALVLGNTINVDPTEPSYHLKPGTTRPVDPESERWGGFNNTLLAHECTHVWSYQHFGSRYAVDSVVAQAEALAQGGSRGGAYAYQPGLESFFDYGEEQRAMMVQDFVAAVHALRAGAASTPTLFGTRPPQDAVHALQPYLDELRAQGPGQSQPAGAPRPIACASVRAAFQQDGVAGQVGASADALLAATGHAATEALVHGVRQGHAGEAALGALGTAAAVVASVVPREQNAQGAHSGGSAVLDQAGVPHGVAVHRGGFDGAVRAAWDAPAPSARVPLALGFSAPRFELSAGYRAQLGLSELAVDADVTVGREGPPRSAGAHAHLATPTASLDARARLVAQQADAPLRGTAELSVTTGSTSVDGGAELTARDGHLLAAAAHARLDTACASVSGATSFAAPVPGAPLAFRDASLEAALRLTPDFSLSAHAAVNARGLEALGGTLAASHGGLSMSLSVAGLALTSVEPKLAFQLSAGDRRGLLTVGGQTSLAGGAQQVTVGLSLPLP